MMPVEGAGYWIAPSNHFFVVRTHIREVCDYPEHFGTTEQDLRAVFEHFGEPWASEGRAREHVIRRLVLNGWIRTRHYPRRGWTFNLPSAGEEDLGRIAAFFIHLYGLSYDFTPVHVDSPARSAHADVADFQRGKAFPDIPLHILSYLNFIESPAAVPIEAIPEVDVWYPLRE